LNSYEVTDVTEMKMLFEFSGQESHSTFSATNRKTEKFWKTLQTLARDSNRPLDQRRGRLMM